MRIIVDIDGTICTQQKSGEYHLAEPIKHMIDHVNKLYDEGHEIIYWTARGMKTNTDYTEMVKLQLTEWNCKYHEVRFNKPDYDLWIDDKAEKANELSNRLIGFHREESGCLPRKFRRKGI